MKKTTALWTFTLLVILSSGATAGEVRTHSARSPVLTLNYQLQAPPQAAKVPAWKSREEYDAFDAMTKEKDPNKKISLAEAFIQKYPTSDFKDSAYLVEMQTYQQMSPPLTDKAAEAARKALEINPDNLQALRFLSFTFPFLYKPDEADHTSKLSRADSDARHGLEVLQKFEKPAGASDETFQQAVKDFRAVFNSCIGFVALQNKDYANAITALKAANDDNISSWYAIYWRGLAYLYSTPRDYNNGIWYYARAVSLAKAGKDPNAEQWEKYLKQVYVGYHGTDTGLSDIMAQSAASANPPEGFKIEQPEAPKASGNPNVDAFNTLTFPLKLGGETATKTWDGVKGQAIELGGSLVSVEKSTDPAATNLYLVHIAILDSTKSTDGYDIELKDTTQPNVKNLQKGDLLRFKGTADSYTATPNLILTLVGEVTTELPDKPTPKDKPKPKPPVHHAPTTHKATTPPK